MYKWLLFKPIDPVCNPHGSDWLSGKVRGDNAKVAI